MNNIDFKQPYGRTEFLKFVERDFLPEDFRVEVENMDFSSNYTQQTTRLGTCESLGLEVIEIIHTSNHDARVGLSKEAFRMLLNRSTHNRALILFVPQDNPSTYRFSLVTIDVTIDEHKVRRSYSNPRRYSFVLGTEAKVRTPQEYLIRKGRVKDLDDLQKRFSVEVLTKEFYAELSDWYSWAISLVKFPNAPVDATKEQQIEHNSKNVIRLLTRLLFVWFLKQKHLIPNELFDPKYLGENILKDFDPSHEIGLFKDKGINSIYYKAILQNLFFATLNCPISSDNRMSRGFRTEGQHFDINSLMRYEKLFKNPQFFLELVNSKVPFLNGGLFDCLDDKQNKIYIDGFSDNLVKPNILRVPDYLFFGEEKGKNIDLTWFYGGDKKKKNVNVRGLINILETYNFTIEENTPFDQEVSLDPELLGKVFENLLASYNPETKTTARKQTGSFYTPREIVQYMVDESLIAHLKRTVGEDLESEYRKLMQYTDDDLELTTSKKQEIIRSLNNCKIIDPACGSGAFPVGILQQMVHMLSQLDPDNVYWHQIVKESTLGEMSKALDIQDEEAREEAINDIKRSFDKDINRPDYARKLYLIENCIYGVDIQSIAVQISKLRFFISLVVEQVATENSNDNFGIRPLPNLEAKFVAANTLIGIEKKKVGDFTGSLFDNQEIKKKEEELRQAKHKIYGAKTSKTKQKYKDIVATLRVEIADKLAKLGAIGNDAARELAKWDMFDQNASSPFFDPEWMFGVSDGFDIVIGNPPYGVSVKGEYRKQAEKHLGKVPDYEIYYYFIEVAKKTISEKGIMSYIIPNTYLFNMFADKYRRSILESWNVIEILDCTKFPVFESATVLNTINTWQKGKSQFIGYRNTSNAYNFKDLIDKPKLSIEKKELLSMNQNWGLAFFLQPSTISVVNRINSRGEPLEQFFPLISQGLIAYDKYRGQSENIIANRAYHHTQYAEGYKPWLWGEDVRRYDVKWNKKEYIDYCEGIANPRKPIFFNGERLLIREITNPSIFAALTSEELYNDPAIIVVLNSELYSIKVALAILNSKLATFYHFNHSPKATKGAFPKILVQDIKEFPLPEIDEKYKTAIEVLVDYLHSLKGTKSGLVLENTSNDIIASYIEKVIDTCVYELYFEEEIKSSGTNVLELLQEALQKVSHLTIEQQITQLFNEWNDYKNEIRNRIILQETRSKSVSEIIKSMQ